MPLYEFVCSVCRNKAEKLCPSVVESTECHICGGEAKRILSSFRSKRSGGGGIASSGGCGG